MKTTSVLFLALIVAAAMHSEPNGRDKTNNQVVTKPAVQLNKSTPQPSLVTRNYKVTSARTFMPFSEDPCNHLPSAKVFC